MWSPGAGEPPSEIARSGNDVLLGVEAKLPLGESAGHGCQHVGVAHAAVQSQSVDLHFRTGGGETTDVLRSNDEMHGDHRLGIFDRFAVVVDRLEQRSARGPHWIGDEQDAALQFADVLVGDPSSDDLVVLVGHAAGSKVVLSNVAVVEQVAESVVHRRSRHISRAQQGGDRHPRARIDEIGHQHAAIPDELRHGREDPGVHSRKQVVDDRHGQHFVELGGQTADFALARLLVGQDGQHSRGHQVVDDVDVVAVLVFEFSHDEPRFAVVRKTRWRFAYGFSKSWLDFS